MKLSNISKLLLLLFCNLTVPVSFAQLSKLWQRNLANSYTTQAINNKLQFDASNNCYSYSASATGIPAIQLSRLNNTGKLLWTDKDAVLFKTRNCRYIFR